MTKVLFVCHGNICRSPMAEIIFRDLAERHGVGSRYQVKISTDSNSYFINDRRK